MASLGVCTVQKNWPIFLFLVCLILTTTHGKKGGGGGGGGKGGRGKGQNGMRMFKCKGQDANMEIVMPYIPKCIEESHEGGGGGGGKVDMKAKFLMMKVCVMEGLGVVKNNQFDKEKFDTTIEMLYPGPVGKELVMATGTCVVPENTENLSKENNYSSYSPLMECLWKSLASHCKQEGGKKKSAGK